MTQEKIIVRFTLILICSNGPVSQAEAFFVSAFGAKEHSNRGYTKVLASSEEDRRVAELLADGAGDWPSEPTNTMKWPREEKDDPEWSEVCAPMEPDERTRTWEAICKRAGYTMLGVSSHNFPFARLFIKKHGLALEALVNSVGEGTKVVIIAPLPIVRAAACGVTGRMPGVELKPYSAIHMEFREDGTFVVTSAP